MERDSSSAPAQVQVEVCDEQPVCRPRQRRRAARVRRCKVARPVEVAERLQDSSCSIIKGNSPLQMGRR